MKHLVIASDLFKPSIGGTETVTENMAKNMVSYGWRVTVVAPSEKNQQSPKFTKDPAGYGMLRINSIGIPVQQNLRFAKRSARSQIEEYFSKNENRVDIVHVNNPFPSSKIMLRFAKNQNIPVVAGSHLMPESFTTAIAFWSGLKNIIDVFGWRRIVSFYNQANAVVSPTKTGVSFLRKNGLSVDYYVISNGIDLNANKPLKLSPEDKQGIKDKLGIKTKFICSYVGRLGVEKQVGVIIEAIATLQANYDISLVLVGDGNATKRLKRLAKKLGVGDRVIFTGFVNRQLFKRQVFAISNMFAIASPVELQSIVTLEAMAAGLPIFACNAGALPELAKKGVNGDTFPVGDSDGLARQLGYVMQDSIRLKQYSKRSLELIKHHDSNKTWSDYNNMYNTILLSSKHNNS